MHKQGGTTHTESGATHTETEGDKNATYKERAAMHRYMMKSLRQEERVQDQTKTKMKPPSPSRICTTRSQ